LNEGTAAMTNVSGMSNPINPHFLALLNEGTPAVTNVPQMINRINPDFLAPLNEGWQRQVYFDKKGEKITKVHYFKHGEVRVKSARALKPYLAIYDLKTDNFKFKKVILGINDPEKEVIIVSRRSRQKQQQQRSRNSNSRTETTVVAEQQQ